LCGRPSARSGISCSPCIHTLFVLTNALGRSYLRAMTPERTAQIIQFAYPQVYLACHTRHQRKRTSIHRLSARDSSILAHLDVTTATMPARLAAHLSIARSTLSEALKRLTALGYTRQTTRSSENGERGGVGILLTSKGLAAIRETSVLETPRLREVLDTLSPSELRAVARGMSVLANACSRRSSGKTSASSSSSEQ